MKHNRPGRGRLDRVEVHQQQERQHWAKKFGVEEHSVEEHILRQAIEAIGPMVEDVERYLEAFKATGRFPARRAMPPSRTRT